MSIEVSRRDLLKGAGVLAGTAFLAAACGAPGNKGSSGSSSGSTVSKIVFMTNSQDATAPAIVKMWNDGKRPFPVELRTSDDSTYGATFPRLATVSDAPNIAGYFIDGGHFADLAKAGALLEMSDMWQAAGLTASVPVLIRDAYTGFAGDGKLYAAPTNTSRYGMFFYRKSILQGAGVDLPVNHEFTSEAEFTTAADKLKKAGLSPIDIGAKDGYPTSHLQDGLLSSTMAPDMIHSPLKIDYMSSEWMAPIEKLVAWQQAGYFARGFLGESTQQSNTNVAQGKVGFSTGMNVWVPLLTDAGVAIDDLDWVLLPPIGDLPAKISIYAGGGIVIPKIAGGHDQAKQFGEFLVSPEVALYSAKNGQVIPARTDVAGLQAALGTIGGSMYDKGTQDGKSQFGWDDATPTDMITYDRNNLQAVLAGTQSVKEFCQQLESLKKGHL